MGKRTFAVVGAYCTGDIFGTALCGNCGTAKEVNMHRIQAKNILSATNGMNLYRGCTHGCIYCDSRSACYQMGHDFEDVAVKENAPQLLEEALRRKRRLCMIGNRCRCRRSVFTLRRTAGADTAMPGVDCKIWIWCNGIDEVGSRFKRSGSAAKDSAECKVCGADDVDHVERNALSHSGTPCLHH